MLADEDLIHCAAVPPDAAAVSVEFVAGAVMLNFSLISLVVLADISIRSYLAGADFRPAQVVRLIVLGGIFACGVLLGACFIRQRAPDGAARWAAPPVGP